MNRLRYALIAGMCVVSYLLVLQWNEFQEKSIAANKTTETTLSSQQTQNSVNTDIEDTPSVKLNEPVLSVNNDDLPSINETSQTVDITPEPTRSSQLIHVQTDKFDIMIDTLGGDLVKVALKEHLQDIDDPSTPFTLMDRTQSHTYIAQSGLIGPNGTDISGSDRPTYSVNKTEFILRDGDESLNVDLHITQPGANIIKRFRFSRNSYLIDVDYIVNNTSQALWKASPYGQIRRSDFEVSTDTGIGMSPFLGAAITTNETNYVKKDLDDIAEETVKTEKLGGWVAMVQHYFVSAWIPNQKVKNHYKLFKSQRSGLYIFQYTSPLETIEPGQNATLHSEFYVGPKNIKTMSKISPYLDLTIDYSWLWFIAKPLFYILDWIQQHVINWGLAIIFLTVLIKIVFFYPSAMSYRSMAKMRKLQPMMAELKERYGDDRQKMSSELMKIYKKEKVNPLGGCLPILLQMPVFISLYWVLMESVELRHAPFTLWITDLSVKDPYFILPLIMGLTMFIQQKLNPTPPDPMQAKVMQMMPIFMTVLFLMFPAGLVLYWVVNNTLSITQQYIITRQIENAD